MVIFHLGPIKSTIAAVLGTMILALGEVVFSIIYIKLFGASIITSSSIIIRMILPIPQIVIALSIIYLFNKYNLYLFNFKTIDRDSLKTFESKRIKKISVLILILLVVLFTQIALNIFVVNASFIMLKSIPLPKMGMISTVFLILGVTAMALLIKQLFELTQKESQYYAQALYIDTLDELYTAVRSERHDIINHLQTIYGFSQLGYTEEVQDYINDLLGGNILSNEFINTGTPGLTALFYIKSGIARTNEIKFRVTVEKKIENLRISSYELNNILGNLINNAFDAVMQLENSQRDVNVYIGADDNKYIFTVSNYGHIDEDAKLKIMKKGFSTKKGEHAGLGLHICKNVVEKYDGNLEIKNSDNHMVEFSVLFPRHIEKEPITAVP